MSETDKDKPDHPHDDDEHPGGRPETPPGQGGEQPGNRPDVPPGHDKPEEPDDVPEPTHPIADPEAPYVEHHEEPKP